MNFYLQEALKLHSLGLNIFCISNQITNENYDSLNLLKSPCHKINTSENLRQSMEELILLPWEETIGIGMLLGPNNISAIDIDGVVEKNVIDLFCEFLNIPLDYKWIISSGSNCGFHIIYELTDKDIAIEPISEVELPSVYSSMPNGSINFSPFGKSKANAYYPTSHMRAFNKMEFLWNTHLVLPPSQHICGNQYNFINGFPNESPIKISLKKLLQLKEIYCSLQATYMSSLDDGRGDQVYYLHVAGEDSYNYNFENYRRVPKVITHCTIYKVKEVENLFVVQIAWLVLEFGDNVCKRKVYNYFTSNLNYFNKFQREEINYNKFQWEEINYDIAKIIVNNQRSILQELIFDIEHVYSLILFNQGIFNFIIKQIESCGLYTDCFSLKEDGIEKEKQVKFVQKESLSLKETYFYEFGKNSLNSYTSESELNALIKVQLILKLYYKEIHLNSDLKKYYYDPNKEVEYDHNFGNEDNIYTDDVDFGNSTNRYGYDQNTIDNAFDGDPENYWNID